MVYTCIEITFSPVTEKRSSTFLYTKVVQDNYRPTSVLPIDSKMFKKYVHKHLYSYYLNNNILCETLGFEKIICYFVLNQY